MANTPTIDLDKPPLSTNPVKPDVWGGRLNTNFDKIDAAIAEDRAAIAEDEARITALEAGGPGGSGGHIIVFEGVELPQRSKLEFGAGFYVYDDAAGDRTVISLIGSEPEGAIRMNGEALYMNGEPVVMEV